MPARPPRSSPIEPSTGAVKAMFGGDNFRRSQFNLATQAERQPGSSFKPIVLATALREGLAPVTRFDSKPVTIDAGDRLWRVTNYDDLYLGSVNLADALVRSDNAVYAQLTKLVRPKNVVETAHRLGIGSDLPAYFSIGLGAVAVNPLDMARAYATIANDGYRVDGAVMGNRPRVVESVVNRRTGKERTNERVLRQALAPGEARTLTSILERVVRIGTGTRAAIPGRATAGKTGTTDNYGDAWFVGYTPQLVVAVWVGYPNELKPMLTEFEGRPVTGGTLPALIWKEYMSAALRQQKAAPEPFADAPYLPAVETRVVFRDGAYRRDNGYCPGTRLLAYVSGREPPTTADCKQSEVTVPSVVGSSLDTAASRLQAVPLTPKILYAPAPARQRPGTVVRQYPRARVPLGRRRGHDLRDQGKVRPGAEPRRLLRGGGERPPAAAEAENEGHLGARARGNCARAKPATGRGSRSRVDDQARRRPRESQGDPLTT